MLTDYGLITAADAALIAQQLDRVATRFKNPVVLEIGVRGGETARAISRHMGRRPFRYWGIDSNRDMQTAVPFPGAQMVIGDSAEVFGHVPEELHFVLLDGCHCRNHVVLDFLNYGAHVPVGGVVVFHDSGAKMQGRDYQGHGPQEPPFFVDIAGAFKLLQMDVQPEWEKVDEADAEDWGGAVAYERVEL